MHHTATRRVALAGAIAIFSLSALASSAAGAATIGNLRQLSPTAGCVSDASAPIAGCASGAALLGTAPFFGSHAVALSPDGRYLYAVAFNSDSVVVFSRNSGTGALRQLPGAAGCLVNGGAAGCTPARALLKPTSIDLSPDGRSVYVASIAASSIAVFARNTANGRITQRAGAAGCVSSNPDGGCTVGRALDGADVVAVSPDGRSVYAGAFGSDAVVAFTRNRSTGGIFQKPGVAGCVTEAPVTDCAPGRGLGGAEGLTISPEGESVYVGAAVGNAVAVFRRDRSTGNLSQAAGTAGCSAFQGGEGCANGDGLVGADSLQVSPDSKNLYVASGVGDSVAAFRRNRKTGGLTQLPGVAGCYTDHTRSLGRCNSGVELDGPEGIAVSPDGRSVYVGSYFSGAITLFDRTSFTGTINQRAGAHGCIVDVATTGCTTGTALVNANALAISPDGRSLYAGAYGSNAIAVFGRAEPDSGRVAVSVPSRLGVPGGSVVSIPVSCSGTSGRRCPGGISLGLRTGAAGSRRGGSFNIAVGKRVHVSVVMPRQVRRALSADGSVTVTVTMRVVEPSGRIEIFSDRLRLGKSELG